MNTKLQQILAALGALVFTPGIGFACEEFNFAAATAIDHVPYQITAPGLYYLSTDCTYNAAGAPAILIEANEVVLDLNGKSLIASGPSTSPDVGIGIAVLNHEDVTIQDGDVVGFGAYGVLLDASDGKKEHNEKNTVCNVHFNNDLIGVLLVSGSIDEIEHCDFEGGSVGIYDIASLGGDRFQADNFQQQTPSEAVGMSVAVFVPPGNGTLTEDCLVADDAYGLVLGSANDKYRFDSFANDGVKVIGGTEENAGDL
jgi:hypothetical protein